MGRVASLKRRASIPFLVFNMGDGNIVHIVGTGTIGEPLIGLLCDFRRDLGIDEITFYKHTPALTDRPKIKGLLNRGANLAVSGDKVKEFRDCLLYTSPSPRD